jgi:acetyltransferase-like isoleucine patch superfamily enzyme
VLIIERIKLKLLYSDCLTFGSNFRCKRIDFEVHPIGVKIVIGNEVQLRNNAIIRAGKNSSILIGNYFFANKGLSINALGKVQIGNNTIFGEDVKLYDHNHGYKRSDKNIQDQPYSIGQISIGNNCWIGSNCIILKDVSIGNNCIIGANCVVYKNLPDNTVINNSTRL